MVYSITFHYTNNTATQRTVNGKSVTLYQPLVFFYTSHIRTAPFHVFLYCIVEWVRCQTKNDQ